jgi:hypothetical protein
MAVKKGEKLSLVFSHFEPFSNPRKRWAKVERTLNGLKGM